MVRREASEGEELAHGGDRVGDALGAWADERACGRGKSAA